MWNIVKMLAGRGFLCKRLAVSLIALGLAAVRALYFAL